MKKNEILKCLTTLTNVQNKILILCNYLNVFKIDRIQTYTKFIRVQPYPVYNKNT